MKQQREDIEKETDWEQVPTFECSDAKCLKVFVTLYGLEKHIAEKHPTTKLVKTEVECKICLKSVKYLDKHMKAKHSDIKTTPVCEICLKEILYEMKKHRKICINCIHCGYENAKKARLLKHMKMCERKPRNNLIKNADPIEPLDLSSPIKLSTIKGQENLDAVGKRSLISKEDEDNDTQLDTEMTKE